MNLIIWMIIIEQPCFPPPPLPPPPLTFISLCPFFFYHLFVIFCLPLLCTILAFFLFLFFFEAFLTEIIGREQKQVNNNHLKVSVNVESFGTFISLLNLSSLNKIFKKVQFREIYFSKILFQSFITFSQERFTE